jgi:hypothetical protein
MIKMKDGTQIAVKSSFGKDKPVSIVPTNTNGEKRMTIPVRIPSLDTDGNATFDYAVDGESRFTDPIAGIKITIE